MVTILQREEPGLRKKSAEVPIADIGSPKIKKIIEKMKKALAARDDGVAIAAPQIGELLRIFIVAGKVAAIEAGDEKDLDQSGKPDPKKYPDIVFINPRILKLSKETKLLEEGCLSVHNIFGTVRRSIKAKIEAYDEQGKRFVTGGSGLLAQIFQHETDHLEGILFIDKAKDLHEINATQ